jgi:outer membrane protein assembly factor BamB
MRWKFQADAQVHCAPCVADGLVIIAGCDGKVRSIDLQTAEQAAAASIGANFAASPAWQDGTVYSGSLNGDYLAVDSRAGTVAWNLKDMDIGPCYAGAAVDGNAVVFASRASKIFRVDAEGGQVQWTFRTGGKVDSSPVIVQPPGGGPATVIAGCSDGKIYGINLDDGSAVWEFAAGGEVTASPAIAGGRLVIGTADGIIYCLASE